jgi:hypothetical protein
MRKATTDGFSVLGTLAALAAGHTAVRTRTPQEVP